MKFLKRMFAGMAIGVGAAIPGVSGAAIALIFKVYEDIIDAVNNFRKRFSFALMVLIPILIGIILALIPCIYLFSLAFEHMMFVLICVFAGFLIGTLPTITKEVKNVKPSNKQKIIFISSLIFVILMGVCSVFLGPSLNISDLFISRPWWLYLLLIPVGAAASIALTVPGLSGSLVLLVIGFYRPLIDSVKEWGSEIVKNGDWSFAAPLLLVLICFAFGCLLGVILTSKTMNYLLTKHHDSTYFAIIGFIVGSIFVLFFNNQIYNYYLVWGGAIVDLINPLLPIYFEIPIGVAILAICVFASWKLSAIAIKNDKKEHRRPEIKALPPEK